MFLLNKDNINNMMLRQVRSFVSRHRKLTFNQQNFFKEYFLKYGISFSLIHLDFSFIFGNANPVVLEVGFGTGESLIDMAMKNLNSNFIGIEVHIPSILSCFRYINKYSLTNVRIIFHDAVKVISYMISNHNLFSVHIFFPDPWFKKRHHKRRIIRKEFLEVILKKLMLGGYLHIATDCKIYAESILTIVKDIKGYINLSNTGNYINRPNYRLVTKFEKRGIILGNEIFDLKFKTVPMG